VINNIVSINEVLKISQHYFGHAKSKWEIYLEYTNIYTLYLMTDQLKIVCKVR